MSPILTTAAPASMQAPPTPATPTTSLIIDSTRPDRAALPTPPAAAPPSHGRVAAVPTGFAPFVLRSIRLEGSSAPDRAFQPVLRRFVGRRLDAAGLKALADAVGAACAHADIALYTVVIPTQDFGHGIVRVRVIEGYVESVQARSKDGRPAPQVTAFARPLLREHPLRRSSLDHALLLMRALPGVTIDVQILRGARDGAVKLAIVSSTKRFQLASGISDRGANRLGRTQLEADATINSLFRQGDRTTITLATPTDFNRFRYYAISHAQPIGDRGLTLQASLGYLETRPQGLNIRGTAEIASLQASLPLQLQADRSLYLTASIDGLDSSNALLGETISDERTRAIRASAAYARAPNALTSFSAAATFSQGLPGLGARTIATGYSDTDFSKLSLQGAVAKAYGVWRVRVRATAQISRGPLPPSEQLALGGDDYGRAFPSAVVTGDEGAAASAELAWTAAKVLHSKFKTSELYGFVDGGRTRAESRPSLLLPGATYDLASAGVGARVAVTSHAVLQLEASRQLVADLPDSDNPDWRVVFGYRTSY